jgi:N-acetylglutamate synthase-like GNAT family acetyltransferase
VLITRASRRDLGDVEEFYDSHGWFDDRERPDLAQGVMFVARQGPIVGCVRLIDIDPETHVVEDVVVADEHRGKGTGAQLMQAAMNNKGGSLYLCCHGERLPFYERLGFKEVPFEDLPAEVQARMREVGDYPTPEGHVHHFMRAR